MMSIAIPLDVPIGMRDTYLANVQAATHGSGRLMLFAGDQKTEHMNDDFYGPGIHRDDADPEHLFSIASKGRIGLFATHMGLIARYGGDYPSIPYLVKLNGKTNLIRTGERDPESRLWHTVEDVISFRKDSDLSILGVGYSLYPGSIFEAEMLSEAARIVTEAHRHGLITLLWIYPRGKSVKDERDPHLIAGAAGLGAALGSDFVKVNAPVAKGISSAKALQEAVLAAGRTRVICAGGPEVEVGDFLQRLYDLIHVGGASGNATGRNIHQKSLEEAVRMCNAIFALTVEGASVEKAISIFQGK
jgi:fructose-bisphosphate aldolase/6-deoxy-5-ketofructose 1-phosphate synthase